jgi:hypothetical protein
MKAFNKSRRNRFGRQASSFSLTEKSVARERNCDEHNSRDILTPGLNLIPAFPVE